MQGNAGNNALEFKSMQLKSRDLGKKCFPKGNKGNYLTLCYKNKIRKYRDISENKISDTFTVYPIF